MQTKRKFVQMVSEYHFTNGAKPDDDETTVEAVRAKIAGYFFVLKATGAYDSTNFDFDPSDWDEMAEEISASVNSAIADARNYDLG